MSCVELVRITKKAKNNLAEAEIWFREAGPKARSTTCSAGMGPSTACRRDFPLRHSPSSWVKAAEALHKARDEYTLALQTYDANYPPL